jgi:hypothetical protein
VRKVKTYETWFKDIFKSKENDIWNQYMNNETEKTYGYNSLMNAADEGNLKKFKYYFPKYVDNLNSKSLNGDNALIYVVIGDGVEPDKKIMISMLLDNGIDYTVKHHDYFFYELIKEYNLKKWVEETYPDIIKELEFIKDTEKYNI